MKLGEIKLEALRIMNINNDSPLYLENIETIYGEKRYAKFLNNMLNAINKAIDIINYKKVLPKKNIELSEFLSSEGKINNRFDLTKINDFLSINKIVYEDDFTYYPKICFEKEGENLVISNKYNPNYLKMIYEPKIPNITDDLSDNEEIPNLKDEFARLIPYYIKFELYQEDEPNLALTAKNTFDNGIESLRIYEYEFDSISIENIYSIED